jgi:hypothetical protein
LYSERLSLASTLFNHRQFYIMKHPYIIVLFALLISFSSLNAQIQAGQWANPFTLTDVEGNEHRLYDYLADGKTVIIHFSAVWSGQSWQIHQSNVLQSIWEDYGPEGTDQVVVLFIECDPGTNYNQITGAEGPSMGNWTQNAPYPIINTPDWLVPNYYDLDDIPTVVSICPDMKINSDPFTWSNMEEWSKDNIIEQILACEEVTPLENDIIVHSYDVFGVDCYEGSLDYQIINGGSNVLTNAKVALQRDGQTLDTYEWSGSLAYGEAANLSFENISLAPSLNEFTLSLIGVDEEESNNNVVLPFLKSVVSSQEITVYLQTDENAEEDNTRWYIEDENGNILAESGPLLNDTYTEMTVSLETEGCFYFKVSDEGGDGLTGSGFILATDDKDATIFENPEFGSGEAVLFQVQATVNTHMISADELGLKAMPNPTTGLSTLQLDLDRGGLVTLDFLNLTGQRVAQLFQGQLSNGQHTISTDWSTFPTGVYLLRAYTPSGIATIKIVKQ